MGCEIQRLIIGFMNVISRQSLHGKIVIELAVGFGTWGHLIRAQIDRGAVQAYLVGCDIHKPYLVKTAKYNPYDDLIICDVTCLPIRENVADLAIACEVVEHLSKKQGEDLLKTLPRIAKKIYVSLPCGYMPQGRIRGNEFEEHRSAWTKKDLENLGYDTEITGLSPDFEEQMKRLKLYGVLQKIRGLLASDRWSGTMLCATYSSTKRRIPD